MGSLSQRTADATPESTEISQGASVNEPPTNAIGLQRVEEEANNACVDEEGLQHTPQQESEIERLEKEFLSELEALVTPKTSSLVQDEEEEVEESVVEELQHEDPQQTTTEMGLVSESSLVSQEPAFVEEKLHSESSSPMREEELKEAQVEGKLVTVATSTLRPAFANEAEEKLFIPCLAYLVELMAYDKKAWPRTTDDLQGKLGSVSSPTKRFAFLHYHLGVVSMRVDKGLKFLSWNEQRIAALVQGKETLVPPEMRFIRYMVLINYIPTTYKEMVMHRLWKEFSTLPRLNAPKFFKSLATKRIVTFNSVPFFHQAGARAALKEFDHAPPPREKKASIVAAAAPQQQRKVVHSFANKRDGDMFALAIETLRALLSGRDDDRNKEESVLHEAKQMDKPLLAYLRHHMSLVFQRKEQGGTVFYYHKPRVVAFVRGTLPLIPVEMRFLRYALVTNYAPTKHTELFHDNGSAGGGLWEGFNCALGLDGNKFFQSLELQGVISRTTTPVFRRDVAKSVLTTAEQQYPAIEEQCRRQCIRDLTSIGATPPSSPLTPTSEKPLFANDEEQRVFKLAVDFLRREEAQRTRAWPETLGELIAILGEENQSEIRSFLMFHLSVVQFVPSSKGGGQGEEGPACIWDMERIQQVLSSHNVLNTPKVRFLRHAVATAYRPTSYSALTTGPVWTQFNKLLKLDTTQFFHDLERDGIVSQTIPPVLNLERAAALSFPSTPKLTGVLLVDRVDLLEQFYEQGKYTWNHCNVVAITVVADAGKFASVQVASQNHVAVFDCQALGTSVVCEALRTLLESSNVTKLFHDLRFASSVMMMQISFNQVLDTQLLCEQIQRRMDAQVGDAVELFNPGCGSAYLSTAEEALQRVANDAQLLLNCWFGIRQLFASKLLDRFLSASKMRAATAALHGAEMRSVWFDTELKLCSGELLSCDGVFPSPLTVHARLDVLLQLLPERMVNKKTLQDNENNITEIVLDKGKLPYFYVAVEGNIHRLSDEAVVTEEELGSVIAQLGGDASFSREGNYVAEALERELHRISVLRNAQEKIYGLTLHVGHVLSGGVAESIKDLLLLDCEQSILVVGPTGSGKTTLLRDAARLLATKKRVCVVDTRNELGGNSDIAADCLGDARRVMVSPLHKQSDVIKECVHNFHASKGTAMVIDEIDEEDMQTLRAMQQRSSGGGGMRLIAGMCARDFRTLMENSGDITHHLFSIVLELSVNPQTLEHTISVIMDAAKAVNLIQMGEQIPIQVRKRHAATGKLFVDKI